jgi:hypothetical protein
MVYDVKLYFANGTSMPFPNCREINVVDGVLNFTTGTGEQYISNMPFTVLKRKG